MQDEPIERKISNKTAEHTENCTKSVSGIVNAMVEQVIKIREGGSEQLPNRWEEGRMRHKEKCRSAGEGHWNWVGWL